MFDAMPLLPELGSGFTQGLAGLLPGTILATLIVARGVFHQEPGTNRGNASVRHYLGMPKGLMASQQNIPSRRVGLRHGIEDALCHGRLVLLMCSQVLILEVLNEPAEPPVSRVIVDSSAAAFRDEETV